MVSPLPLAKVDLVYSRSESRPNDYEVARRRFILWGVGLALAALLYFGVPAFFAWKHPISSSGGKYFIHRVVHPVPELAQDDPRWTFELLGPTYDTIGQAGCAITSAAMVLSSYGVDTDPSRLNQYLDLHQGYTPEGWVYWEKAAEVAPYGQVEKAYEDLPSYALIDQQVLAGNPVIVRLTLRNGHTHFVVIVGKQGWDYLIEDPARPPTWGVYPLKDLTREIQALRFYRVVPPVGMPALPKPVPPVIGPPLPASVTSPATVSTTRPPTYRSPRRRRRRRSRTIRKCNFAVLPVRNEGSPSFFPIRREAGGFATGLAGGRARLWGENHRNRDDSKDIPRSNCV